MEGAEMEEPQEPLIHEVISGDAQGPQSLADQLRAKRAEIADTRETFVPIVGYNGPVLATKHKLMDRHEIEVIGRRVARETKDRGERNMRILVDQIIDSTLGFYYQRAEDPDPVQLQDDSGAPILGWDHLAIYLGWEGPTPGNPAVVRTALYFVFGDNEFAIGQYGILLNRWMGNTAFDVDQEFLGEGV
jgi:hypothetical protein